MSARKAQEIARTTVALAALEHARSLLAEGRDAAARAELDSLLRAPRYRGDRDARHVALSLLAQIELQRGNFADSLAACDQLLILAGRSAGALTIRAEALHRLGRLREALANVDQSVELDPLDPRAWTIRGVLLGDLGRPADSLACYDAALLLRPDYVEALNNRGAVLNELGCSEEALVAYDQALAIRPDDPDALSNRGLTLASRGRLAEALESYDAALQARPRSATTLLARSVALRRLRQPQAALDSVDQGLALGPDDPLALNTRGLALAALDRWDEALADYDRALRIRPMFLEALNNSATALEALERFDEALARQDAALAQDPGFVEARFNSGLTRLRVGDWCEGWRRHEARWRRPDQPGPTFPDADLWLGESEIAGSVLLLHAEQGLGDTIQFCRYAPLAAARGARVLLQVQPALKTLLSRLGGVNELVGIDDPLPRFDRHTPLMSLPLALGLPEPHAPMTPYLSPDPALMSRWVARLSMLDRPRVGLVWAGAPAHLNDANRSLSLESLTPLLACPLEFVSLQKDVPFRDQSVLSRAPQIVRVEDGLVDFADTAALVSTCDLIIAADTAVAHLAAALGKPVWILLPRFADWRWMSARNDSPWYSSVRLFRQTVPGDWRGVVDRVSRALAAEFSVAAEQHL